MARPQKPDFVFPRNGRVHLNRWGRQFSRLLADEVCASASVVLDRPRSEVAWEYWLPTPFASFPFTSPPVRHHVPPGSERALQLSRAVPLRSGGHRGRWPDNDVHSDKVCLHSQQLAKITETKGLTVLPTAEKARIFRRASKIAKRDYYLCHVSLRPPARPHGTRLPLDGFSWNFIFQRFLQICRENSSFIKIWQE